jgi:hypothetical protein
MCVTNLFALFFEMVFTAVSIYFTVCCSVSPSFSDILKVVSKANPKFKFGRVYPISPPPTKPINYLPSFPKINHCSYVFVLLWEDWNSVLWKWEYCVLIFLWHITLFHWCLECNGFTDYLLSVELVHNHILIVFWMCSEFLFFVVATHDHKCHLTNFWNNKLELGC